MADANEIVMPPSPPPHPVYRRRRNQPGNPNPDDEVVALSPTELMATNRFVCEVCNKGFQREQNLQLHRRGHNLPWKLKQRGARQVRRKVYLCPEPSCVHHDPARALGDLTGIKKHYSRKHGVKKYKCEKCAKKYAVQSDWKAHCKTCGTRDYQCDCGMLFARRDSFVTHRAFCDAINEARNFNPPPPSLGSIGPTELLGLSQSDHQYLQPLSNQELLRFGVSGLPPALSQNMFLPQQVSGHEENQPYPHGMLGPNNKSTLPSSLHGLAQLPQLQNNNVIANGSSSSRLRLVNLGFFPNSRMHGVHHHSGGGGVPSPNHLFTSSGNLMSMAVPSLYSTTSSNGPHMSATALLQKAAQIGSTTSNPATSPLFKSLGNSPADHSFGVFGGGNPSSNNTNHHMQDFLNSSLAGNGNMFGGLYNNHDQDQNERVMKDAYRRFHASTGKLQAIEDHNRGHNGKYNNPSVVTGGRMTRDFLGVGGIHARNIAMREQQHMNGAGTSALQGHNSDHWGNNSSTAGASHSHSHSFGFERGVFPGDHN